MGFLESEKTKQWFRKEFPTDQSCPIGTKDRLGTDNLLPPRILMHCTDALVNIDNETSDHNRMEKAGFE